MIWRSRLHRVDLACLLVASGLQAACGDQPTAPDVPPVLAAPGGGGGGGTNPVVNATDPTSAPQNITLDVRVLGTNFSPGSVAKFLLNGKATTTMRTNSTRFVSATELVANLTITIDAVPELYDVQVTAANGRKGIGVELFAVTGALMDVADKPTAAPAGLYEDGKGLYDRGGFHDNGQVATGNFNIGAACDRGRAYDPVFPAAWASFIPSDPSDQQRCRVGTNMFHVPGLLFADCADGSACPIGGPHDPADGPSYADDLNYNFQTDSNGDNKWDDWFNVIWVDARFSVEGRAFDGTPCIWHITGNTVHLWKRQATPMDTNGQTMRLEVTVIRTDGVCAT